MSIVFLTSAVFLILIIPTILSSIIDKCPLIDDVKFLTYIETCKGVSMIIGMISLLCFMFIS